MKVEIDGERVKAMMEKQGLTVPQLCRKGGFCSDSNMRKRTLNGINWAQQHTADRICKGLECTIEDIRPLTAEEIVEERYGISLFPIASLSQVASQADYYTSPPRDYSDHFYFLAAFRLLPKFSGFLTGFSCGLYKYVADKENKENVARKYCSNEQPQMDVNATTDQRPNFQVNDQLIDINGDYKTLAKPLPIVANEILTISYRRRCRPRRINKLYDEHSDDYLIGDMAHISCSLETIVNDSSNFKNFDLGAHEWLYWYTFGGEINEGISPRIEKDWPENAAAY